MADMDARLIVQVLINLINNAIKYTEDESTISINAYQIKIMCILKCVTMEVE